MKTYLSFFGRKLDLASRERRRWFVVVFYISAAIIICVDWHPDGKSGQMAINVIIFTMLGGSFLGGYATWKNARNSLVKPFEANNLVRDVRDSWYRDANRTDVWNDERELARRDNAHYRAWWYFPLIFWLAFFLYDEPVYHAFSLAVQRRIVFLLIQIGFILSFTLPQAILLWTEPDLEPDPESETASTS